ncbi:MAG: polysaccharide lyase 6 family protein [Bacteroidetes bacterium]|nr:polysaccharide lyase 6 family protein [Bacteroidota bacterium]
MKTILVIYSLFMTLLFSSCSSSVNTPQALSEAVKNAAPGDTIIMANGNWENVEIRLIGKGEENNPIVIRAEEAGKVIISGNSFLKLSGEWLEVSGLLFTNGSTPDDAVIIFRTDKNDVANNCRVTNCVIDAYNPPDRFNKQDWVHLYGKKNRIDHCYFGGKLNAGVTLVVKLNDEKNRENYHRIDHNYFGERQRLGSNGGETMRIGVSTFSLMSSNTIVENNYFEKCNGETEHVSVKSSDNIIRNNVFYECEGALVLRHGNRNLLEGNYFIGDNKPETGGIRVINKGHTIRNNYFQELAGDRFRSALPIMNGVPNSLINRYHQVDGVTIENNTFVNCQNIKFGVGSDNERTAVPINTTIKNNIFYNPLKSNVYKALDNISGITFENNLVTTKGGKYIEKGFIETSMTFVRGENGLWFSKDYQPVLPVRKEDTGAFWYEPIDNVIAYKFSGNILEVSPESDINKVVKESNNGDLILLTSEGDYFISSTIEISHPLKIIAIDGLSKKPVLKISDAENASALIQINNAGMLIIEGIAFNGDSGNGIASAGIQTSPSPTISHYKLFVDNCEFYNFNASSHNAFRSFESTFADSISFTNCTFYNISGTAINLASEKEDVGKYNVEYLTIDNCLFHDVMGAALDLYRGGNDESTFGPFLKLDHCTFHNVNNKELGSVIRLIGVQNGEIKNSIFSESGKSGRVIEMEDPKSAVIFVDYCNVYNSGRIESYYNNRVGKNMYSVSPDYNEKKKYKINEGSSLSAKGSDGKRLGIL